MVDYSLVPLCDTVADDDAWTTFTKEFNEKFIPTHAKAHKPEEFERLVEGVMSMQDYEFHFTRFSRFAPLLITPESKQIRRFLRGLLADIFPQVGDTNLPTFEENVKMALSVEEALKRNNSIESRAAASHSPPTQRQFATQAQAMSQRFE